MLTLNGSWSTAQSFGPINMQQVRGGQQGQKFGKSRGGFSTKVHATTEALGCPTRFILTGGNASDYTQAIPLIEGQSAEKIVADKGYDSQAILMPLKQKGLNPSYHLGVCEKHNGNMIVVFTKKETSSSVCSTSSNSFEESQVDTTNWRHRSFPSCISPPSLFG